MRHGIGAAAVALALATALGGCSKSSTSDGSGAPASGERAEAGAASPAGSAVTSSAGAEAGAAPASPASPGATAGSFTVKYTLAPATMYIAVDEKGKPQAKFTNDEAKYLGEGTLSLTIGPDGRVTGTSAGGPLGDAIANGFASGSALSATILRKDPEDGGLTGTLVATISGDKIEGTMKLAESNAAVVREAKVSGAKK